jgi:hypothetical protein
MSEITVRRVGAQVIMMLVCEDAHKIEVTMNEAEAATLGSQLMGSQLTGLLGEADRGAADPYKPRKIADLFSGRQFSPDSVLASGK